jgi:hypothetical protein
MPDYREITITITDGDETAHIWTCISKYRNRLLKLGATETRRDKHGSFLTAPAAWFWPRKQRRGTPRTNLRTPSRKTPSMTAPAN